MAIARAHCEVLKNKVVERSEILGGVMVLERECWGIGLSKCSSWSTPVCGKAGTRNWTAKRTVLLVVTTFAPEVPYDQAEGAILC